MFLVRWFQVGNCVRGEVIHGRHFFKIKHRQENSLFHGLSKEKEWVIYEGLVGGINRGESEDLFEA